MRNRFSVETILAILVASLSILTAFGAYHVSLAEAKAGELDVKAIKTITESNTEFLRSNQEVMLDYAAYDNYVIQGAEDDDVADYYRDGFSEALEISMMRPDGPFDDPYFDEIFLEADMLYDESLDLFDAAQAAGEVADQLQLVMLITAVGLSLSAFASIGDQTGIKARMFIFISTIILIFGVVRLADILIQ